MVLNFENFLKENVRVNDDILSIPIELALICVQHSIQKKYDISATYWLTGIDRIEVHKKWGGNRFPENFATADRKMSIEYIFDPIFKNFLEEMEYSGVDFNFDEKAVTASKLLFINTGKTGEVYEFIFDNHGHMNCASWKTVIDKIFKSKPDLISWFNSDLPVSTISHKYRGLLTSKNYGF